MYWVYLDRRTQMEDRQSDLETQTFNLFPERWVKLYQDKVLAETMAQEETAELPVTDIDALDQWYEQMVASGGKGLINGDGQPPGTGPYWTDWG